MRIIQTMLFCLVGLLTLPKLFGQYIPKPFPTYSLDNMPRTGFSCQGKILGGYYADPETQCQMFHVCVKVAGVGIKDFRFLCPNGTAFDQEAQICADWGDVDCEQATLYYSSDNFDLYRLGSGFESKRAPVAEDETPFHLQNAESNDLRRTPQQNNYNQNFNRKDENNNFNEDSNPSTNGRPNHSNVNRNIPKFRKTTTTTSTTTPEPNYQADRRGDDEIFKGSHSSNFFNNRNNGKEDDLEDFPQKPTPQRNYVTRSRPRPQNPFRNNNNNNNNIQPFPQKPSEAPFVQPTTTTTTTFAPPSTARFRVTSNNTPFSQSPQIQSSPKTLTLQSSFRTSDLNNYEQQNNNAQGFYSSSTTEASFQRNYQTNSNYQKSTAQQNIQPTTYSPPYSSFVATSSTPSYDDFRRYEKTSTTVAQKLKEPTHNSFYNAQFEKKASEGYDEIKNQQYQFNGFTTDKTSSNTNDFERTASKPSRRVNIQRQNSFIDRSTVEPEAAHSIGEQNNNFAQQSQQQQPAPQRQRRPNRFRGTKSFDRKLLEDLEIDPLQVRPLGSEQEQAKSSTTTTTTERSSNFDQGNFNRFSSFRNNVRNQTPAPNNYNTPAANNYNTPAANNFNSPTPNNFQSPAPNSFHSPAPNNFNSATNNNFNAPSSQNNFPPTTASHQLQFNSPAPKNYNSPSPTNYNSPTPTNYNSPTSNNYNSPTPANYNSPASSNYNSPNSNNYNSPPLNNFNAPSLNNYNNNNPKAFDFADEYRPVPSPFSLPNEQSQKAKAINATQEIIKKYPQTPFDALPKFNEAPRGFSLNPSTQNFAPPKPNTTPKPSYSKKYDEQSFDSYTPSSNAKKFSTLVPKDQYYPTTFKPATYKKVIQGYDQKIGTSTKYAASSYLPTSTTTTYRTSIVAEGIDEDDGQYHPELYEKDFVRNKAKTSRNQQFDRTYDRRPVDQQTENEEDEFLNTAHSLNIAAGANQLRADREKNNNNNNKLSSPSQFRLPSTPTLTTTTTTTRRPAVHPTNSGSKKTNNKHSKNKKGSKDEDTSYDYAYYDSFSGNPQDYEYDLISEFGKTRKN